MWHVFCTGGREFALRLKFVDISAILCGGFLSRCAVNLRLRVRTHQQSLTKSNHTRKDVAHLLVYNGRAQQCVDTSRVRLS